MTPRSPFQRFTAELRRRHVPQTAAVYAVAAWAAIQFADVVVPNLGWPQWVVPAVIIASALGLPVVLVMAWFLEWGPEGIHRTTPEDAATADATGESSREPAPAGTARALRTPWAAAVGVLVVGIAATMVVALVIDGAGEAAPDDVDGIEAAEDAGSAPTRFERRQTGRHPESPPMPDLDGIVGPGYQDSIARSINDSIMRGLGEGDGLAGIIEMATRLGESIGSAERGGPLQIMHPSGWRFGAPFPVTVGDTLRVRGVARSDNGVAAVELAGEVVVRSSDPGPELSFEGEWVAGETLGELRIPVTVVTEDGQRVTREYPIVVIPKPGDS